jgi:GTPase
VTVLVVDATAPVGKGDRFVAGLLPGNSICVVNKVDAAPRQKILQQLEAAAAELGCDEFFPLSARTGKGVSALVEAIVGRLRRARPGAAARRDP